MRTIELNVLKKLLEEYEFTHKGYLQALNDSDNVYGSKLQISQVEALLTNILRLRGLIMWIEQNERAK